MPKLQIKAHLRIYFSIYFSSSICVARESVLFIGTPFSNPRTKCILCVISFSVPLDVRIYVCPFLSSICDLISDLYVNTQTSSRGSDVVQNKQTRAYVRTCTKHIYHERNHTQ